VSFVCPGYLGAHYHICECECEFEFEFEFEGSLSLAVSVQASDSLFDGPRVEQFKVLYSMAGTE
jgi:hypothetical protein